MIFLRGSPWEGVTCKEMATFGGKVDILANHFLFLLKFHDFAAKYSIGA